MSGLLWNTLMCIHVYIDVSYVAVLCPKTSTLPPYLCLVTGRLIGFFPHFLHSRALLFPVLVPVLMHDGRAVCLRLSVCPVCTTSAASMRALSVHVFPLYSPSHSSRRVRCVSMCRTPSPYCIFSLFCLLYLYVNSTKKVPPPSLLLCRVLPLSASVFVCLYY